MGGLLYLNQNLNHLFLAQVNWYSSRTSHHPDEVLAKNTAIVTFTETERWTSNVNGKAGKKRLSPERVEAVKEAVF